MGQLMNENTLLSTTLAKKDTRFLRAGRERCFTARRSYLTYGLDGSKRSRLQEKKVKVLSYWMIRS